MSVYKGNKVIAGAGITENVKYYIRNQNILSDWENITVPAGGYTAPYDGFIAAATGAFTGSGNLGCIKVNNMSCNSWGIVPGGTSISANMLSSGALVKKGDVVTIVGGSSLTVKARFYKLRDYSGR
jgi:hypothetical protein